ncbi:hypothetical protein Egran_01451, partial [Elaphomyces granulatus]
MTPLHLAAENGCDLAVKLLIDHGADVAIRDDQGQTPLDIALETTQHNEAVVRFLREKDTATASQDTAGSQLATREWSEDITPAESVVDDFTEENSVNGKDRNSPDRNGRSLADTAAAEEQTGLHEAAEAGALIDVQTLPDEEGGKIGHSRYVPWVSKRLLKERLTSTTVPTPEAVITELNWKKEKHQLMNEHDAMAALLIQKDAAIMEKDRYGVTALHLAAHSGNICVARRLLINGADITATDEDGWSPLHVAVHAGNESVVWLLLKAKYEMGTTAGLVSSRRRDLEV